MSKRTVTKSFYPSLLSIQAIMPQVNKKEKPFQALIFGKVDPEKDILNE
jgi:hypothetical protein